MKSTMIIYTDSSWKDNKCGYAFSCRMTINQTKPTFIYGNCLAKTSTEAEMIAVIKSMEYIKQYCTQLNNIKYEIRVDEQWIAEFMIKKPYKHWNKDKWIYSNGTHRRKNARTLYKLMKLFQSFPQGTVEFRKVKSKLDGNNFVVDRIAHFASNENFIDDSYSFIVSNSDYKSIVNRKINQTHILINEYNFIEYDEILKHEYDDNKSSENMTDRVKWIDSTDSDIVMLPVEDIFITELEHLKCKRIDFNGVLAKINKENEITTPVAVRRIDESNKYSLVAGIKRLFIAKILGIKTIPAIITQLNHYEFTETYR